MIKFFRNIRQNLLNEGPPTGRAGKTAKYFKYAIGEIVLVVIGILIALSINNWNEVQHQKDKERKILGEIMRDLESNVSILQNEIETQEKFIEEITFSIKHLKNKKPYNDSIDLYLNHAAWIERIQFTSSSYESLKAIGINIISSDSLRADIANLFGNEFPFKTMWLRDAGLVNANFFIPFYVRFFETSNYPNTIESNVPVSKTIPVDYDSLLKSQEFINALSRRRGFKLVIVAQLKILQNYIEETIISIQNELENF